MATAPKGFGPKKETKKVSKTTDRRVAAGQQLDEMRAKGLPEFTVFIRIQDQTTWLPIGTVAVSRSSQVHRAIFANEDDLRQGAFRLFPRLKKYQANLEYGFRVKGLDDEPIELAVRPAETPVAGFFQKVQSSIAGLFRPQPKA